MTLHHFLKRLLINKIVLIFKSDLQDLYFFTGHLSNHFHWPNVGNLRKFLRFQLSTSPTEN